MEARNCLQGESESVISGEDEAESCGDIWGESDTAPAQIIARLLRTVLACHLRLPSTL